MALSDSLNNVALETDLYGRSFMLSSFLPLPHVHLTSESPKRLKWRQRLMDYLDETRPHNLVLISAWSTYAGKNMRDRRGQHHLSGTSVMAHNAAELGDFCAARGIQLWIVKEVPYTNEPSAARDNLAFSVGRRSRLSNRQRSIDEHIAEQAKIAQVFRPLQNGKTRFVDPAPLLFDQSGFTVNYRGGRALYRDKGHLTRWGAATIKPVISAMFAEMSLQLKREIDTNN